VLNAMAGSTETPPQQVLGQRGNEGDPGYNGEPGMEGEQGPTAVQMGGEALALARKVAARPGLGSAIVLPSAGAAVSTAGVR
jgi:hypothetical protein